MRKKQIEVLERLKDVMDPLQPGGLSSAFECLIKALRNLYDGSMPVVDDEKSENASVKKFVIYFERVSRERVDLYR